MNDEYESSGLQFSSELMAAFEALSGPKSLHTRTGVLVTLIVGLQDVVPRMISVST